jgi:hypothetical protein
MNDGRKKKRFFARQHENPMTRAVRPTLILTRETGMSLQEI